MFIDNLRISGKLSIAFAAVVLTMTGMGASTYHSLKTLETAREETERSHKLIKTLEGAKFYLARQENSYRGFLLSANPYYIARIDKHRGNFRKQIEAGIAVAKDEPAAVKTLQDIAAAADKWHAGVVETGIALAGDPASRQQAIDMVGPDGIADGLIAPAEDGVAALYEAETKRLEGLAQQNAKVVRGAYMTLAGCIAFAVLIAAGLGMVLTRVIAGPVTALTTAMRKLASGDFTVEVPARDRKDEVGLMAEAVAVFKSAGVEKLRLEGLTAEQHKTAEEARARNEAAKAAAAAELHKVVEALGLGLERLSAGDLTYRVSTDFPADYLKLKDDFNAAMGQLQGAMAVVVGNVRAIRSGSGEIASAADHLSKRTEHQAANLEETAAALEQITATMKRSAASAADCAREVQAARGEAQSGGSVVGQAVAAMSEIESSAREINNIIGVIDEIAFQTNLLALNAGVEAARAGDAGKGFAVVAQEVRALAQRSADAAKEIKTLIGASADQVERGVELVGQTGESLNRIIQRVAQIDVLVTDMAAGAQEQARGIAEVNIAVNQMDQLTQQNAAMVEESTAASHSLSQEADVLDRSIGRFTVDTGAQAAKPVAMMRTVSFAGAAARKPAAEAWQEF